jgi:hypothetical protein
MNDISLHNTIGGRLHVPHLAVPPCAHSECPSRRSITVRGLSRPTEQPLLGRLLQLKPASALQFRRLPGQKSLEKATRPIVRSQGGAHPRGQAWAFSSFWNQFLYETRAGLTPASGLSPALRKRRTNTPSALLVRHETVATLADLLLSQPVSGSIPREPTVTKGKMLCFFKK